MKMEGDEGKKQEVNLRWKWKCAVNMNAQVAVHGTEMDLDHILIRNYRFEHLPTEYNDIIPQNGSL
jgi:hypothetical protein